MGSSDITDIEEEFNLDISRGDKRKIPVYVYPFANTFEDFVCGFTSDSSEFFSVDPTEGRMGRQGEAATAFNVAFSSGGKSGEFKATLCIVFPDDEPFNQYFRFTVNT